MTDLPPDRIRFNGVGYRQGFLEVANVHEGHVNLEVWTVHPDIDITGRAFGEGKWSDADFTGNTEIELSVAEARELIAQLGAAIVRAEHPTEAGDGEATP